MNTCVASFSGQFVNLAKPKEFNIHDIAIGLSRTARFRGQTNVFYSVAEHCLTGAFYFINHYKFNTALAFLLHDAVEAYISDIPTPFKNLVPGLRQAEEKIIHAIYSHYGVFIDSDMSQEMKNVDECLAVYEAERFGLQLTPKEHERPRIAELSVVRFEQPAPMYKDVFELLMKVRKCKCF